jgi:hypothetical protein
MHANLIDRIARFGGHSASVQMWLHTGDASIKVLQSSEAAIKVSASTPVAVGKGTLETVVDGRSHQRLIQILSHATPTGWVEISSITS